MAISSHMTIPFFIEELYEDYSIDVDALRVSEDMIEQIDLLV